MTDTFENSRRIQTLRRSLIAALPRFPNDKASLQMLEAKKLTDLLIVYIAWRLRHVAVRPRQITGREVLDVDPRATLLAPNITAFLNAVEEGNDLTPYLSLLPRTKGYTPASEVKGSNRDNWADKDFILNVMGLHHFHLGVTKEPAGHIARTNQLLFALVTRDTFEILGLFDHKVFEREDDGSMTAERSKLWSVSNARLMANVLPGEFIISGGYANLGLSTSGHPTVVVHTAIRHYQILRAIDPKLEDPAFVRTLYGSFPVPNRPRLEWSYSHLDFGLLDKKAGFFASCLRGPN